MRVEVLREKLSRATTLSSKASSTTTKLNLPILSNLLITAESNELRIEASNLELSIRLTIPAKVEEPGQTTVPARKFTEYLNTLSSEKLSLVEEKSQLYVRDGSQEATFVTMNASDFPELPRALETTSPIVMPVELYDPIIRRTVFAASPGDTHPVLGGIFFDFSAENELTVVATDSFRLSLVKESIPHLAGGKFIIPATTVSEIHNLLSSAALRRGGEEEDAKLVIGFSEDENQVFFRVGEIEVISRLIDAEFPDYERIRPTDSKTRIEVDRQQLIDGIKTTAIFAAKEGQAVRMHLNPAEGMIKLSAQSSDVGSFTGEVKAEIEGETVEMGFNSKYLLDGISSFSESIIQLKILSPTAPCLFEPVGSDSQYQHIIMPMSLHNNL